ncbi:two-component regulator propeller domain-containing protein, partial [Chitinimonas sp.]|uniref:ligand-binding sensor domain-containing protein n=1 Tax=Chitinimonas sp. TaxID=1934313 RepID=UPI0035AEFA49
MLERILCIAHALILAGLILLAGPAAALPPGGHIRFTHLGTSDGLSNAAALTLAQDRQGFIWIGTQTGLDRFDGHELIHFRRDSGAKNGLLSDWINVLHVDRDGVLWVGT